MSDVDERKAANLLERYVVARRAGERVQPDALLRECPEEERENLRLAMRGTDFVLEYGAASLVSPASVRKVQDAIDEVARRREATDAARERSAQQRPGAPLTGTGALEYLATLLGIGGARLPVRAAAPAAALFRKGTKLSPKDRVIARTKRALIESQGAEKARALAVRVGAASPPVDPVGIARDLGILVVEENLTDCDGCIVMYQDVAGIVVDRNVRHPGRKRFTVAHELGHFELHRQSVSWYDTWAQIEAGWESEAELAANSFAAELLLPEWYVRNNFAHHEPTFDAIDSLAEQCQVSTTAAAVRLARLSDYACAVVYVADGKIRWFAASDDFPYWVSVGDAPHPSSGSAALERGEPVRDRREALPATIWARDDARAEEMEIWEHSRSMQGAVLTLLYAEKIPDDDEVA